MSRITADVIDVMENEQTRIEILTIAGMDAGEFIDKLKELIEEHEANENE